MALHQSQRVTVLAQLQPPAHTGRVRVLRQLCRAQRAPGAAIERADPNKSSLATIVKDSVVSPFTAVPIAAAAAGAYFAGYGYEGAVLGIAPSASPYWAVGNDRTPFQFVLCLSRPEVLQ